MGASQSQLPRKNWILIAVAIVALLLAAWLLWPKGGGNNDSDDSDSEPPVSSFEECVSSGHPVMESYPRQCRAGDEIFTEQVDEEIGARYEDHLTDNGESIRVMHPISGDQVNSPLQITGEVRSSWTDEGEFPVELLDGDDETIATATAAMEENDSQNYVTFNAELEFSDSGTGGEGLLVLYKNDPSESRERDDYIEIPVEL